MEEVTLGLRGLRSTLNKLSLGRRKELGAQYKEGHSNRSEKPTLSAVTKFVVASSHFRPLMLAEDRIQWTELRKRKGLGDAAGVLTITARTLLCCFVCLEFLFKWVRKSTGSLARWRFQDGQTLRNKIRRRTRRYKRKLKRMFRHLQVGRRQWRP